MKKYIKMFATFLLVLSAIVLASCDKQTTNRKATTNITTKQTTKQTTKKTTKKTTTGGTTTEEVIETASLEIRIDTSKDTNLLKNTVTVTNVDTNTEVKNNDMVAIDANLKIKLFNKASDVHIRVTMDDFVVYEWFYFDQLTNNTGNDIMDLSVSGNIIIEVNTGTIPLNYYKVNYSSDVENVVIKAFWSDFDAGFIPEEVPFNSGDELVEETPICIEVTNNNTTPVMLVLYINDKVDDYKKIDANSEGHFYNRKLDGKMDLKVEEYANYTINYTALANTTITVYNSENTFDPKVIENGSSNIKYTSLRIDVKNNSSAKVMLTITYNDKSLVKIIGISEEDNEYQANNLMLEGNMTIETKEITGYTYTINYDSSIDTDVVMVNACYDDIDGAVPLENGDTIPTGAEVYLAVFNGTNNNIEVKLIFGSTTETLTFGHIEQGQLTDKYLITGNLTVTVK